MTENFFTVKFRITPNLEKYLQYHGIDWREEEAEKYSYAKEVSLGGKVALI